MTEEEFRKFQISQRDGMLALRWQQIEKLKTRSSVWHGKWAIVCHENNVLRRKIEMRDETIAILRAIISKKASDEAAERTDVNNAAD